MKALVAGFGNIFFRDDGFGCEVVRMLLARRLPDCVRAKDFGIGGMHAAFEMLEGYDLVIFVDAVSRGEAPGTLYVIRDDARRGKTAADAHAMQLENVLSLHARLASDLESDMRPDIFILGCEPESAEEGIGLSDRVAAAVPAALPLIGKLLAQYGIGMQTDEVTEKQTR